MWGMAVGKIFRWMVTFRKKYTLCEIYISLLLDTFLLCQLFINYNRSFINRLILARENFYFIYRLDYAKPYQLRNHK